MTKCSPDDIIGLRDGTKLTLMGGAGSLQRSLPSKVNLPLFCAPSLKKRRMFIHERLFSCRHCFSKVKVESNAKGKAIEKVQTGVSTYLWCNQSERYPLKVSSLKAARQSLTSEFLRRKLLKWSHQKPVAVYKCQTVQCFLFH